MNKRLFHLDLIRGLAALLVCSGHLRAFLFCGLEEIQLPSVFTKVFYFLTGLGRQAVMVFFVLSGFFVAGSVVDAWKGNRWSWRGYALRRLTRLWLVLLPALVVTLAWDSIGAWLSDGKGYNGCYYGLVNSGPTATSPASHSVAIFLGNAAFVQTLIVPVFGTNGPLWSLANEFWYYALFPMLWVAALGKGWTRWVSALLAGVLFWRLPASLLLSGIIWLLGLGSFIAWRTPALAAKARHPLILALAGLAFVLTLCLSKTGHWLGSDYCIGTAFALLVPGLAARNSPPAAYQGVAVHLSELSYTLYVMHFPALAFVAFVFIAPTKYPPGLHGFALYLLLLAGVLAYSWLLWWCFERNTDRLRRWLEPRLGILARPRNRS
jgi:peptidoglycan/LPS O-acetylase OafA/YrhL